METGNLMIDAQTAFSREQRRRRRERAIGWLTRRSGGGGGKRRPSARRFRPGSSSRTRWERLWVAGRRGASLPPISVYRLGDEHFVRDGHHRVSVALSLGMAAIDAEVTELR